MDKIPLSQEDFSHDEGKDNQEKSPFETEIQWALRGRNHQRIDILLSEDSRQCGKDSSGRNPFILACLRGDENMVEILLKHLEKTDIDINALDVSKINVLHMPYKYTFKWVTTRPSL